MWKTHIQLHNCLKCYVLHTCYNINVLSSLLTAHCWLLAVGILIKNILLTFRISTQCRMVLVPSEGIHRNKTTFTLSQQGIVVHDLCHLFKGFIDVLLFKTMGFVLMDVRVGLKHFSGVGQHPSKGRHHRL